MAKACSYTVDLCMVYSKQLYISWVVDMAKQITTDERGVVIPHMYACQLLNDTRMYVIYCKTRKQSSLHSILVDVYYYSRFVKVLVSHTKTCDGYGENTTIPIL